MFRIAAMRFFLSRFRYFALFQMR